MSKGHKIDFCGSNEIWGLFDKDLHYNTKDLMLPLVKCNKVTEDFKVREWYDGN